MWNNYEIVLGLILKQVKCEKGYYKLSWQNLNLTQAQLASSVTIVNALNDYFLPKTYVTCERYKFNTRNQALHKRIDEYVSASDGFNVRGGLERNFKGDCGEAFCGGCFVVFLRGTALQHLSSGGAALTFFVGATYT